MPSLLVRSVLAASFLAACGDNQQPDPIDEAVIEGQAPDEMAPDEQLRPLDAFVSFSSPDCERPTLGYEAVVRFADDDSPVTDLECFIDFGDGVTSDDCVGLHTYAMGGLKFVTLTARDRATGSEVTVVSPGVVEDPITQLTAFANAPACGLEFSWGASWFGNQDSLVAVFYPPENIVDSSNSASIIVSEPGTYTVTVILEQERVGPICTYEASASVEVVACDKPHEHDPDCGH